MGHLNNLYLTCTIDRVLMCSFLCILLVKMYKSIDQFSPDSKTVKLDELVRKYETDDGLIMKSENGSVQYGHQRANSLYRFDQFYKHYMRHLIDEMEREDESSKNITNTSGRMNNTTLPFCVSMDRTLLFDDTDETKEFELDDRFMFKLMS